MTNTKITCAGMSLVEICIVVVLLLVIAGVFLPITWFIDKRGARHELCSNKQRQLVLGMSVYSNDSDSVWPVFTANSAGDWVAVGDHKMDATATAIASFELLSQALGGDLTEKVFACPSKPLVRPKTPAGPVGSRTSVSEWARQGPSQMGYSYDWSIPTNGTSRRVVIVDRDHNAHPGAKSPAAYADGHVSYLPRDGSSLLNLDADRDDIYSAVGDGPMGVPGEGSTTRAFVGGALSARA